MSDSSVSRRHFFFGSLLAGTIPAAGFGSVPSLKALGYKSYNEKLNIAAVGVGGRGAENLSGFLSENIVALCDVDSRQGGRTFKRFEKAPNYVDFRRMLDKEAKHIDAVVISTADHMHATVALWCMQRGKHVYVEKPLTRTPWEARLLAEAAVKYKVATQMGNQGYSHEGHRTACEIIWSGEIGNVTEVHANTSSPNWPQGIQTIPKEEPIPTGLDWDLWLGCAPMRPYTSGGWDKDHVPNGYTGPYNGSNYGFYVPHDWRGFYDFGTGALGDAAIHALGPANQALALGMPIAVECLRAEHRSKFSYPLHALLRFDFPARGNMPPVSVYWSDGARDGNPENYYHPKGLENEVLLPAENNLTARGRPDLGSGSRGSIVAASALGGIPARRGAGVLLQDGAIFVGEKGYLATVGRGEGVQLRYGARIKVAEVPPGPPVLETLVAEVYGPSMERRIALARQIRDLFKQTNGVVDVDWYVEDDQQKYNLSVDEEKAAINGISEDDIARAMQVASAGYAAGLLHQETEKEDVSLTVRLDRATRSDMDRIQSLKVTGHNGHQVALGELVHAEKSIEDKSIYHKNLMPVTYVTADIAGEIESPVYAVLKLGPEIDKIKIPEGYQIEQHMAALPSDPSRYSMKWDGEWHITYEVFRDLGIAFAAVLILIYGLVVGWFQSFVTPLIIMAAIPFSLVGILPAHGLLHAFFTATSMIGFIAGAGIVVRNSIILVDFIELRLAEGMPLVEAVIDAGAVRFRPMMLTAAAVVVGSSVILFDPIFQGLAIALMAGEIASLLLSRMTVPVLFYLVNKGRKKLT